MATVFVSTQLPGTGVAELAREHQVILGDGLLAASLPGDVAALITVLTDRVDAAVLERLPALRVVANVAVGYDNVDVAACAARGVVVTNTPHVLTESTADFTFGLLLAAARRIAEGDRIVRAGRFTGWTPTYMLGTRVSGMTLGIVGLGRIGQAVARRARGFGMRVVYTQRTRAPEAVERALCATYAGWPDLLALADAVTLHCPLTPATQHLIDRRALAAMKPGAILIYTARGGCVDEGALAEALERGPLAACGLDVYEREPAEHPRLLACGRAVLAPHLGSADTPTREAMTALAVANVAAVLAGEAPLSPVTK